VITLREGDCRDVLATLDADSVHACVTDPPYHLTNNTGTRSPYPGQYTPIGRPKEPKGGFMGKQWDGGDIAFQPDTWRAVWRVLKPGGYLVAFGGTRTYHRMTCAIEDAGFEIRDTLCWLYGSGFPKSHDISKAIDRAAGAEREVVGNTATISGRTIGRGTSAGYHGDIVSGHCRDITTPATPEAQQWAGWGTALKPAFEPIILARKPLVGAVAANVLAHGTGAINIDACRVATDVDDTSHRVRHNTVQFGANFRDDNWQPPQLSHTGGHALGRWPANVLHDGSDEVEAAFAAFGNARSGGHVNPSVTTAGNEISASFGVRRESRAIPGVNTYADIGTASRFFYSAKADRDDRADSKHPTVKPVELMRWLVRLITPPGGTVLDPFAGSGTTGEAAMLEGLNAILIEHDPTHANDIRHRIKRWSGEDLPLFAEPRPAALPVAPDNPAVWAGGATERE